MQLKEKLQKSESRITELEKKLQATEEWKRVLEIKVLDSETKVKKSESLLTGKQKEIDRLANLVSEHTNQLVRLQTNDTRLENLIARISEENKKDMKALGLKLREAKGDIMIKMQKELRRVQNPVPPSETPAPPAPSDTPSVPPLDVPFETRGSMIPFLSHIEIQEDPPPVPAKETAPPSVPPPPPSTRPPLKKTTPPVPPSPSSIRPPLKKTNPPASPHPKATTPPSPPPKPAFPSPQLRPLKKTTTPSSTGIKPIDKFSNPLFNIVSGIATPKLRELHGNLEINVTERTKPHMFSVRSNVLCTKCLRNAGMDILETHLKSICMETCPNHFRYEKEDYTASLRMLFESSTALVEEPSDDSLDTPSSDTMFSTPSHSEDEATERDEPPLKKKKNESSQRPCCYVPLSDEHRTDCPLVKKGVYIAECLKGVYVLSNGQRRWRTSPVVVCQKYKYARKFFREHQ